jgi:hypothetical protein
VKRRVTPAVVAVALLAAAVAGCTIGPDDTGPGTVIVTVTRDFGQSRLLRSSEPEVPASETVMRLLQRSAKVETRYGGRFVSAINGLRSSGPGGGGRDWFYYVNGIEADVGAAEREIATGDRIWWDYHDWSAVMRVPAVVGSFPEPFIRGTEGKKFPVRVDCGQDAQEACERLGDRLERAGISPSTTALGAPAGESLLRFVVGRWEDVRRDAAARQIEEGPDTSGVFARFRRVGERYTLELLDPDERVAAALGDGSGLIAATRFEEQQPTWVVSGPDDAGLERAVDLVSESVLRDRFAVAATAAGSRALPVTDKNGSR